MSLGTRIYICGLNRCYLPCSISQLLKGWVLADLHSRWRSRILKERAVLTSQLSQLLSVNKYQVGFQVEAAQNDDRHQLALRFRPC
jgi:hypothetical protein